ncbi:AraC family transcriptional regulator ligand-binding domain-containing protein [Nocardia sp. XZ_19_385]|uniref:AraC family transcriptional regulator ligand-binding domain-containing protein n=1 Tax=Nocardia sp. XZ_19_385 TaxID=2769488 RepID=UPI0018904E43|nr:AraC family transcriptional regulator ligand-binding domain-containing protein [Nocardia sp. XZ_19_385]
MGSNQVLLLRFVITQLVAAGLDRGHLVRDSGFPEWALETGPDLHVPSAILTRLWELAEHGTGPDIALWVGQRYELNRLGLYDYLFSSAPTLGAGLATCDPYITAVSTNHRFELVSGDRETSLRLSMFEGEGRGRDLTLQFGLAGVLHRARRTLATPVAPIRVSLRQSAPPDLERCAEVFGTTALEFDADEDCLTFRTEDMALPLTTADPMLAAVLRPLAEALPPPPALAAGWSQLVAKALEEALSEGEVSLELVAHRLAISPRTLQRRLREADTTWRTELDRARGIRLRQATTAGQLNRARQAQLLGYANADSMRRAARRWSHAEPG